MVPAYSIALAHAAAALGIPRTQRYTRLRRFGLPRE